MEYGQPGAIQGEAAKSTAWAPLIVAGEATGVVSLQNLDREHAFTESDLRVLTTLLASLSLSLENARLIHETRQRVTELGTINEIGQALASQLDLDPMYELVGDLMRDTFAADLVYVAMHDAEADRIEFAYYSENGERQDREGLAYGEGLTSQILRSRKPLLLNRDEDFEALGGRGVGTPVRSYLGVPILVGDRAIGVISVQSQKEEGRFGPGEMRLLVHHRRQRGHRDPERPAVPGRGAALRRDGRPRRRGARDLGHARPDGGPRAGRRARQGADRGRHQRRLPRRARRAVVPGDRRPRADRGGDPGRPDPARRGDHRRLGRRSTRGDREQRVGRPACRRHPGDRRRTSRSG